MVAIQPRPCSVIPKALKLPIGWLTFKSVTTFNKVFNILTSRPRREILLHQAARNFHYTARCDIISLGKIAVGRTQAALT